MTIKLSELDVILTNFGDWLSGLEVVFESLESFGVYFVGLEIHVFSKDDVFCDFCSYFIEIPIVE